ncbi:MAG: hypothetical protein HFE44_14390 [Oscillospiraceae bacterium]|jgi:hypothetical protein|nr:hypothetical protein [Oscillospiraceae bacterium]
MKSTEKQAKGKKKEKGNKLLKGAVVTAVIFAVSAVGVLAIWKLPVRFAVRSMRDIWD